MPRAVKALYAALVTALLAASAPAIIAAARDAPPSAAPAPDLPPTPRTPGVRGLEIGVPAYVWANDPMLTDLTTTAPAPSVVVLNPGNGDSPFDGPWRSRADALRARTTSTGDKTRVLGYVHTDHGNRDIAAAKASVDNYLKPPTAASTSTASSSTSSAATAAPPTPPATTTPSCAATSRSGWTPSTRPSPTSSSTTPAPP